MTGHEPETSTTMGANGGETEVSAAGDVVRRAGDVEAVEIVHRNDSVTRLSSDTVLSRPPSTGGGGPAIGLTRGSSWHRVADNDDGFRVELPKGSASSTDGVFTVVCEPNGAAFVVCLEGQVLVEGDDNGTVLRSMQAVDLSPNGALGEAIDVTADELQTDPWVVANQALGHEAAAASVAARLPVAEREPAVSEPEVAASAEAEVEAPEAPEVQAEAPEVEAPEVEAPEVEAPDAEVIGANAAVTDRQGEVAQPEAQPEPEAQPQTDADTDGRAATGATAVLTVPDVEGVATEQAPPEEEIEEEPEEARDHVIVVGRGERRQPTLWVALVLAVIAVALFAIARKTENDRTATQIDEQTATTVAPAPPNTATSAPATTAAPTTATTAAPVAGVTYDITLTKCSQSGTAIAAEGAITNKANVAQNYRIVVRFLGADKVTKVAEADATVNNVAPKQHVSWKATGTYGGNLRNAGGCETERVDIV